jgi:2,3-bisphosphoglycerate-dependent phosphoglycerate mutase
MKIFLIRHGESIANIGENFISRLPDHLVSLTENGLLQANTAGKWLYEYCVKNNIDLSKARIWRSPYLRTKQTCDEFNKYLNIHEIREDITLSEQQFGLFDALPEEAWKAEFPREYAECVRQWENKGKFFVRLPLGESPYDVAIRIHQFFDTIHRDFEKHGSDPLFVFTHGTTLRCFLLRWCHYSPEWYDSEKNPHNCWIRLIDDDNIDRGYIYTE